MKKLLLLALFVFGGCTCKRHDDATNLSKESPAAMKVESVSDLDVPRSKTNDAAPAEGIPIYVSRSKITAGVDKRDVATLGDRATLAAVGVDSKYKGNDPAAIQSLHDALAAIRKEKNFGEWVPAVIVADGRTPFHVMGEVVLTVLQLKFEHYDLVVKRDDGSYGAIVLGKAHPPSDVPPPKASADAAIAPGANVYLGVRIGEDGFALRAFGREIGANCEPAAAGVTVAKKEGAFDFATLTDCAAKQKSRAPQTHDDFAMITAAPSIDWSDVVQTIDALRTSADGKSLFPQVAISIVH